jgi:hypothetical protein
MTGTIHHTALQAKHDEMLRYAAQARRARGALAPKDSGARRIRFSWLRTGRRTLASQA